MEQKKFCTNCGTPASIDAKFCMNCGTKFDVPMQVRPDEEATVSVAGMPKVESNAPIPEQPVTPQPQPESEAVPVQPDEETTVGATTVLSYDPMQAAQPEPVQAPVQVDEGATVGVSPAPSYNPMQTVQPEPVQATVQHDEEATVGATTVLSYDPMQTAQSEPVQAPVQVDEGATVGVSPAPSYNPMQTVQPEPAQAPIQHDEEATVGVSPAPSYNPVQTVQPEPAQAPIQHNEEATVGATTVLSYDPMQTAQPQPAPAYTSMNPSGAYVPSANNDLESTVSVAGQYAYNSPAQPNGYNVQQPYEMCNSAVKMPKSAKKKITAGNVVSTIVSLLLAVILIIPVVLSAAVGAIGVQFSEPAIENAVNDIKVFDILEDSIFSDYEHPDGKHIGFVAYMYKMIYPHETYIDDDKYNDFEDTVEDLLNSDENEASETVREFVADKLSDVMADIRNNTAKAEITADDVVGLVEDIEDDLEAEFGFKITEADYEMIRAEIEKSDIDKLSVKTIKKGNEDVFRVLEYVLSDTAFIILVAVAAVLLILTVAVKGRHFQTGLIIGGVSLALSGGAIYYTSVIISTVLEKVLLPKELVRVDIIRRLVENRYVFTASASEYLGYFGIIVLASAALLVLIGIIVAIVKGVKNKRA